MSGFHLEEYVDLRTHNTFGVTVMALYFFRINNTGDLEELLNSPLFHENRYFVLGVGVILFLQRTNSTGSFSRTKSRASSLSQKMKTTQSFESARG